MSKHAMEAFTDALAAEMDKFGVRVSIIEPGGFNSNIGVASFNRMQARGFSVDDSLYKAEWEESWLIQGEGRIEMDNDVPQEIASAVIDTLESDDPRPRYMVVGTRDAAARTVRRALEKAVEVNQDQAHSFSRDELVEMLDGLLAE